MADCESYFPVIAAQTSVIASSRTRIGASSHNISLEKTLTAAGINQGPAVPKLAPASSHSAARKSCRE